MISICRAAQTASACGSASTASSCAATELKREYQLFLQEHNRGKSDSDGRPDRSPDEIARWAMDHDLPEKDGHVQFPDARIVYEDRDGREHTRDIEVETLNYRGAHASAKASSGFSRHSAADMGGQALEKWPRQLFVDSERALEALDFLLKTGGQNGTQHWVRTDAFPHEIVWETREDREAWEKRQRS